MMKSKLSLKNLAKRGLLLNILLISCLIAGCTSSTTPTYRKEDITTSIQDICKNEYKMDVKAYLAGDTLWVYLPVEDLIEKSKKPEKYPERFIIEDTKDEFLNGIIKLEYKIKNVPEIEKTQEFGYNKKVGDQISNVWVVLRRVLLSMDYEKSGGPKIFCLVTADIKNGFEIKNIFYYLDLKKASYGFISWEEYQHRTIQDMAILDEIIGDKEGKHLKIKEIPMEEFIVSQMEHRIKLKFQKPEVKKNADIDKEIKKVVVNTLKIYDFKDFSAVELNNLLTNNKIILNEAAIWQSPSE